MKKEMLEGGHIVTELIKDFLVNKTEENLKTLMSCLRSSDVFISVEVQFSEEDRKMFAGMNPGDKISPKDKVKINPGIIRTKEGKVYFPVFTMKEKIPEDRMKNASVMKIPFTECIKMTMAGKDTEAMVVNPFSDNFLLNKPNLEIISKLPPME